MQKTLQNLETKTYDPRWFIWTITFLIVSGVSLASYIFITGSQDANGAVFLTVHRNTSQK